jgi:hypothetical protein
MSIDDIDYEQIMDGAIRAFNWAGKHTYESDSIFHEERERAMDKVEEVLEHEEVHDIINAEVPYEKLGKFGHDLYLEVAGHGAGFWDGDWDGVITQRAIVVLGEKTKQHHFV